MSAFFANIHQLNGLAISFDRLVASAQNLGRVQSVLKEFAMRLFAAL